MLEAGLIASRFLHYVAVLSLFGASLYPLYTFRGRLDFLASEQAQFTRRLRRMLFLAVILTLISGLGWFVFTTAAMTDDMMHVIDSTTLHMMMEATDFGPLWVIRLTLAVIIGILLLGWPRKASRIAVPLLAALLLASLAGTGHTRATEGWAGWVHIASDATHLLAAGFWLGGLWPLGLLVVAARDGDTNALPIAEVLRRFSGVATGTVAALLASGLVDSWFLVGSFGMLVSTIYGQLLLAKVTLFGLMALLAAANRFWITPRLDEERSPTRGRWLHRLRYHVVAEQVLGMGVLAVVSLLGTLQPAISQ